jgi:hypothetical protein
MSTCPLSARIDLPPIRKRLPTPVGTLTIVQARQSAISSCRWINYLPDLINAELLNLLD